MGNFTWNRFPIKNLPITCLHPSWKVHTWLIALCNSSKVSAVKYVIFRILFIRGQCVSAGRCFSNKPIDKKINGISMKNIVCVWQKLLQPISLENQCLSDCYKNPAPDASRITSKYYPCGSRLFRFIHQPAFIGLYDPTCVKFVTVKTQKFQRLFTS